MQLVKEWLLALISRRLLFLFLFSFSQGNGWFGTRRAADWLPEPLSFFQIFAILPS